MSEEELVRRLRENGGTHGADRWSVLFHNAADTIERLSSDLAAAQKEAESEGQLRESVAARMIAYLERAEQAEANLSASHQREEQMRRALENIAKTDTQLMMDMPQRVAVLMRDEALRALGKDDK